MVKKRTTRTTPKKAKAKMGRPTSYKPEYAEQARKLCLLGATDKQLADFFGVSEQSLNVWKGKHPEFVESLKIGKVDADNRVKQSLYHRALGYSHPEDKIFNDGGKPLIVATTKHYPPDTTACIFWLKNRDPENWRDKPENQEEVKDDLAAALSKLADKLPGA